jgi:AcrR family transcriptional regulator
MKIDRRVRRTRNALTDALMSLMASGGYRRLSIDSVLDRAKVARSTFYAHFRGKDDLLRENIQRLRALAEASMSGPATPQRRLLNFNRAFYGHAGRNRSLYVSLRRDADAGQSVFRKMQSLLAEVASDELSAAGCPAELLDSTVEFVTGAQWALLVWWLEKKPHLEPAEVHARFEKLMTPVLSALRE